MLSGSCEPRNSLSSGLEHKLVDTAGIEPASLQCHWSILPLNYRPILKLVGTTLSSVSWTLTHFNQETIGPIDLRSQAGNLHVVIPKLVDEVGVEPTMPELQSGVLPFYDPSIEIGGCLVGINSTVSPTSDASTHYVREPVLRTSQDHLPEYQAIGKVHERGGFGPPTPMTNSCALKRSYLSGN